MKRTGITNPALAAGLARLGHGQHLMIVDVGMPIPPTARGIVVDLSLRAGLPKFDDVLEVLLDELVLDASLIAAESSSTFRAELVCRGLRPESVPHQELKAMLQHAELIVRTGEATAYANIALRCGVPF